jgi:hypothetical protein
MWRRRAADRRVETKPCGGARRLAKIAAVAQKRPWMAALVVYAAFSTILFGRAAARTFNTIVIGRGIDQAFFIWCLAWWPFAIGHHLNPFVTKLIFAPEGFNLTWSTSIPLLSLLALPFTLMAGLIATFNLLCLVLPAVTGTAAFVLCCHLTRKFWPSLLGGYVFGFSSYMLGHLLGGHLSFIAAFLVPLAAYLVLARLEGLIGVRLFTLTMAALLVAQFLISTEVFATMTIVGGIALLAASAMGPREVRRRIAALAVPIFVAYAATTLLIGPYLYYLFRDFRMDSLYSPSAHSVDLLNFVVPTRVVWLGDVGAFNNIAEQFTGNISERSAYVGLPLLIIALWVIVERWRTLEAGLIAAMMIVTAVGAMGPRLHVAGRSYFKLPWSLLHRTPLLDQALPARLALYLFLVLAIAAARWLSSERLAPWVRTVAGLLVFASLLPNPSANFWIEPDRQPIPEFFTEGASRRYLKRGEIVATLPYAWGNTDYCMLWQAASGMYFRLAGGYPPLSPASYRLWPAIRSSEERATIADPAEQWLAFAANHGVSAVITLDTPSLAGISSSDPIVATLAQPIVRADGIALYRLRPEALAHYRGLNSIEMEALDDEQRYGALLVVARRYLASGESPFALSPQTAVKTGLPAQWLIIPPGSTDYRIYLYSESDGRIGVGVSGTYEGLRGVIDRYARYARQVYFPLPHRLGQIAPPPEDAIYRPLVMIFDRRGLDQAAALAVKDPPRLGRIFTPSTTTPTIPGAE